MRRFLWWTLLSGISVGVHASDLPVWFDTFQNQQKSQSGWQSFRAATALTFEKECSPATDRVMKAHIQFSESDREAILVWRFPDVQMKKFRLRVQVPKEVRGDVYMRMVTNDTVGDAAFFKPWTDGDATIELPLETVAGQKMQDASPLPIGEWITYEVSMPDDVFFEQKKQKANHPVEEFALMNTGRDQLKLSADSRPATEAFFISFVVPEDSPLLGQELEILVDLAEIY